MFFRGRRLLIFWLSGAAFIRGQRLLIFWLSGAAFIRGRRLFEGGIHSRKYGMCDTRYVYFCGTTNKLKLKDKLI